MANSLNNANVKYSEESVCEVLKDALMEYDKANATIDIAESADALAQATQTALLMIAEKNPALAQGIHNFLDKRSDCFEG